MIAIMLICGGALFLAIGIGALLTPSSQSSTACPHDWPWRSPLTDLEGQDFAWRSAERSRYRAEQNHVAPLRVPLPVTPARSFRRDIIPPRPGGFGGFCQSSRQAGVGRGTWLPFQRTHLSQLYEERLGVRYPTEAMATMGQLARRRTNCIVRMVRTSWSC
jgi:hypothetical protein